MRRRTGLVIGMMVLMGIGVSGCGDADAPEAPVGADDSIVSDAGTVDEQPGATEPPIGEPDETAAGPKPPRVTMTRRGDEIDLVVNGKVVVTWPKDRAPIFTGDLRQAITPVYDGTVYLEADADLDFFLVDIARDRSRVLGSVTEFVFVDGDREVAYRGMSDHDIVVQRKRLEVYLQTKRKRDQTYAPPANLDITITYENNGAVTAEIFGMPPMKDVVSLRNRLADLRSEQEPLPSGHYPPDQFIFVKFPAFIPWTRVLDVYEAVLTAGYTKVFMGYSMEYQRQIEAAGKGSRS